MLLPTDEENSEENSEEPPRSETESTVECAELRIVLAMPLQAGPSKRKLFTPSSPARRSK
jgi:hypothetical protein